MPGQHPAAAVETAVTRQSPPTSLCPDDGVLEGQARKAEAVVVDTTQTTLEMSKPLAKVRGKHVFIECKGSRPKASPSDLVQWNQTAVRSWRVGCYFATIRGSERPLAPLQLVLAALCVCIYLKEELPGTVGQ